MPYDTTRQFPQTILALFQHEQTQRYLTPLNLGGASSGSTGGIGQPPGGIIGWLPQSKISYDTTEAASSGSSGGSGSLPSLVDNLNRIRYDIRNLQAPWLPDSGVVAGIYGSGSMVPIITVDAKGRITAISTGSAVGAANHNSLGGLQGGQALEYYHLKAAQHTMLTAGTSGGVAYWSSASVLASSAALTQYAVVLGGGAGGAPTIVSGLGTANYVLTSNGAGAAPSWEATPAAGWGLTGNAGTNPATNFVGTTDAQPLAIRVSNSEVSRFLSTPYHPQLHIVGGAWNDASNTAGITFGSALNYIKAQYAGGVTIGSYNGPNDPISFAFSDIVKFRIAYNGILSHFYDASNYWTASVSAAGVCTFATLPVAAGFVFTPPVTFSDNVTLTTAKWLGLGASAGRLTFADATPDTAVFSDCNVGIGAAPFYKFHVLGVSAFQSAVLGSSAGDYQDIALYSGNTDGNAMFLKYTIERRDAGTGYNHAQFVDGLDVDSSFPAPMSTLRCYMRRDAYNQVIGFGTGATEWLTLTGATITSTADLTIAKAVPAYMTVNGASGGAGLQGLKVLSGSTESAVFTYSSATGENKIGGVQSYVYMTLWAGNAERVRIDTAGNVGIGMTPTYNLDVTGNLRCSEGFGCNGKTPQTEVTVNGNCTDLASVVALCNQVRGALIANGICV